MTQKNRLMEQYQNLLIFVKGVKAIEKGHNIMHIFTKLAIIFGLVTLVLTTLLIGIVIGENL